MNTKKILKEIKENKLGISTTELASKLKIERHTLTKYLEVLKTEGLIDYKKIGMSKLWYKVEEPILNLLKKDNELSKNVKKLLAGTGKHISVISKDMEIIWDNKNFKGSKCYVSYANKKHICANCPIKKSLKTGKQETNYVDWGKRVQVTATPIKNDRGKIIAVMEIVK